MWLLLPSKLKHSPYFSWVGHRPQREPKLESSFPFLFQSVDCSHMLFLASFLFQSLCVKESVSLNSFSPSVRVTTMTYFHPCCPRCSSKPVVLDPRSLSTGFCCWLFVYFAFVFPNICRNSTVNGCVPALVHTCFFHLSCLSSPQLIC